MSVMPAGVCGIMIERHKTQVAAGGILANPPGRGFDPSEGKLRSISVRRRSRRIA